MFNFFSKKQIFFQLLFSLNFLLAPRNKDGSLNPYSAEGSADIQSSADIQANYPIFVKHKKDIEIEKLRSQLSEALEKLNVIKEDKSTEVDCRIFDQIKKERELEEQTVITVKSQTEQLNILTEELKERLNIVDQNNTEKLLVEETLKKNSKLLTPPEELPWETIGRKKKDIELEEKVCEQKKHPSSQPTESLRMTINVSENEQEKPNKTQKEKNQSKAQKAKNKRNAKAYLDEKALKLKIKREEDEDKILERRAQAVAEKIKTESQTCKPSGLGIPLKFNEFIKSLPDDEELMVEAVNILSGLMEKKELPIELINHKTILVFLKLLNYCMVKISRNGSEGMEFEKQVVLKAYAAMFDVGLKLSIEFMPNISKNFLFSNEDDPLFLEVSSKLRLTDTSNSKNCLFHILQTAFVFRNIFFENHSFIKFYTELDDNSKCEFSHAATSFLSTIDYHKNNPLFSSAINVEIPLSEFYDSPAGVLAIGSICSIFSQHYEQRVIVNHREKLAVSKVCGLRPIKLFSQLQTDIKHVGIEFSLLYQAGIFAEKLDTKNSMIMSNSKPSAIFFWILKAYLKEFLNVSSSVRSFIKKEFKDGPKNITFFISSL